MHEGTYEIRYTAAQFQRAEKQHDDLIVRVIDSKKKVLFASEVVFNALPVQTVDIVREQAVQESEFDCYFAAMRPILEKVKPEELTDQDVEFIAGETRIPSLHIAWFAVAHQFATSTSIIPQFFYGLFRQNIPTSLPALLLQPRATLRFALESSMEQNRRRSEFSQGHRFQHRLFGKSTRETTADC